MPEWLHKQLSKSAHKKHLTGESYDAYVYGSLARYEKAKKKKYNKSKKKK